MADELVSLRQFALRQGWNPATSHRLKVQGRLVMVTDAVGREMVHYERSMARLAENADPQKGYLVELHAKNRAARAAAPGSAAPAPAAPPATPDAPDIGTPEQPSRNATYNQARTAREVFTAKMAQIDFERESGRLVNADQVRSEYAKQISQVRDQFLRLPDRLAPMLVGLGDIDTIKQLIMAEVRTALTQFEVA